MDADWFLTPKKSKSPCWWHLQQDLCHQESVDRNKFIVACAKSPIRSTKHIKDPFEKSRRVVPQLPSVHWGLEANSFAWCAWCWRGSSNKIHEERHLIHLIMWNSFSQISQPQMFCSLVNSSWAFVSLCYFVCLIWAERARAATTRSHIGMTFKETRQPRPDWVKPRVPPNSCAYKMPGVRHTTSRASVRVLVAQVSILIALRKEECTAIFRWSWKRSLFWLQNSTGLGKPLVT